MIDIPIYLFRFANTEECILAPDSHEYGHVVYRGSDNDDVVVWDAAVGKSKAQLEEVLIKRGEAITREALAAEALKRSGFGCSDLIADRLPTLPGRPNYLPSSWETTAEFVKVKEIIPFA